ncbi:MAG: hypothetical protein HY960_08300 [Ignavibacteriae bacterium]|nr:hypothetical protein [Ignavibacteriota bacterium]
MLKILEVTKILPQITSKIRLVGLAIMLIGILLARFFNPEALLAQISGGAIGLVVLIFSLFFPYIKDFPEYQRGKIFLISFSLTIFLILSLSIFTVFLSIYHLPVENTQENRNVVPNMVNYPPNIIDSSFSIYPSDKILITAIEKLTGYKYKINNNDNTFELIYEGRIVKIENKELYYFTGGYIKLMLNGKECYSFENLTIERTSIFGNPYNEVENRIHSTLKNIVISNSNLIAQKVKECL